jgi:hypothetical protein
MIPEMKASFHISSETVTPIEITKALDIQPTKVFNTGDLMDPKTILRAKVNIWVYSIDTPVQSFDILDYITPLLDVLQTKKSKINKLCEDTDVNCIIQCSIWMKEETPILMLPSHIMRKISELNADIDFDLYL